ncbi:MAG TPA: helix-turn-helix transcriptional regulator [Steroidobacteraceae bacterium]|nr:helix-turn-helix transcriptional regulator [Steroidobacteraceae bacterium]
MAAQQLPFGPQLRRWRERRRMTQMDLALAADSSTRHLSCLETGRAQPSREIIRRLADCLNIPLREQNALLLAAGFAPAFGERSVADLEAARRAMDTVLQAHLPYPAFAVDRRWNVVLSNSALPQLYEGCSEEMLRLPVNAVRLVLHPEGMGPRILNFVDWRAHTLHLLRNQLEMQADAGLEALLAEVQSYPVPPHSEANGGFDATQRLATPIRIATRFGTVSFLNTLTVFGTPSDVTLAELALEMLFPADEETIGIVAEMERERSLAASLAAREVLEGPRP